MHEEPEVTRGACLRLGEDAASAGVGVLKEWCGVALEVQSLFPPERDRLLRLHPREVVSNRRYADRLCDLLLPRLGEILATLCDFGVGALNRLVDQVIEVDDTPFPRRHATLGQVHDSVEDRLRSPVDP